MIVCLCEGLNERQIREHVRQGHRDLKSLGRVCGAAADCGACACQVKRIAREESRAVEAPGGK